MKILIIQTGGTIDKDYAKVFRSYHFEIEEPAVKRVLEKVNPNFEYKIISLMKKDSLDMTKEDRELIFKTCKAAPETKILITHGTDMMVRTAEKLSSIPDKLIILTGSLRPEKFTDSDAQFNLGTAIGALNILDKGVYIAMNGRVYPWNKCQKAPKTGQFMEISTEN